MSVKTGEALAADIAESRVAAPTLWWLGHASFAVKFANILFVVDPLLSHSPDRPRVVPAPVSAASIKGVDLVLCTHAHAGHMDGESIRALLAGSPHAKVVLPKSASSHAHSLGVPYERMTTTDADLRVEYFKDGLYGRVYAAPSAHPELDRTPLGGYPYLGYLIRFGGETIYHAGDCKAYPDLAQRLLRYNVTVALLPIGGENFTPGEAADLCSQIGARWVAPMHYGTFEDGSDEVNRFIEHLLGQRPEQRFKVFEPGERWTVPGVE